ncbi:MAG: hypothetical protein KatS3mg008_1293 [Acidimicrobiales bacterium]|nr:MAG: hypothetical protein KatS3mg008_1293 [Acidimicrobiales bacterium]
MTSALSDYRAPSFKEDASAVLAELERATRRLAVSDKVPTEVAELVERFDELFHARDPVSGLPGADPYLVEGLLGGAVVCLKALREGDSPAGRKDLRIGLEQVRQALRDLLDEHTVRADRPAKELAQWLVEVTSVPQSDLAEVLRVPPRKFQRWVSRTNKAAPKGEDEMRLRVVAKIVNHLRHAFTGPGTIRWLRRPHPQLCGEPPASLLDDEKRYEELTNLAARSRSMVAS